jgi:hypothetical protein
MGLSRYLVFVHGLRICRRVRELPYFVINAKKISLVGVELSYSTFWDFAKIGPSWHSLDEIGRLTTINDSVSDTDHFCWRKSMSHASRFLWRIRRETCTLRRGTIFSFETRTASSWRLNDLDDSDQVVLAALEDSPFASVPQLSRLTHLPSMIVYRRLTQSLGFVASHLVLQSEQIDCEHLYPALIWFSSTLQCLSVVLCQIQDSGEIGVGIDLTDIRSSPSVQTTIYVFLFLGQIDHRWRPTARSCIGLYLPRLAGPRRWQFSSCRIVLNQQDIRKYPHICGRLLDE